MLSLIHISKERKYKLMEILSEEHDMQFEVFSEMQKRGWYEPVSYTHLVGLDSEVAYSIPKYRRLPLCGGQLAYNISIVERLLQAMGHRLRITVDDDVLEGDYLIATVCNGVAYGGGFRAAPVSYTHLDVYKRQVKEYGLLPVDAELLASNRARSEFFDAWVRPATGAT